MPDSQPKMRRFYRSNLATIVWDPKNNRALVEFVNGQFYTEDQSVAERLVELGYPEIPLDLKEPPDIFFKKGESLEVGENVPVLPKGMTEEVAAHKEKQEKIQQDLADKAKAEADLSPGDIALGKAGLAEETKTQQRVDKAEPEKTSAQTSSGDPIKRAEAIAKEVVKKQIKRQRPKRSIKRRKKE